MGESKLQGPHLQTSNLQLTPEGGEGIYKKESKSQKATLRGDRSQIFFKVVTLLQKEWTAGKE
jgi:hypothetical protein